MIRILLSLLISLSVTTCQRSEKIIHIASLPISLGEVSGIENLPDSDIIWMINDSGNTNELIGYNRKKGSIDRTIKISNGINKDWEDLATDQAGTLYIGDFGNNRNDRKDLTIYTLKNVQNDEQNEKEALVTTFYYEDQKKFPPKKKDLNYDVEAFIYFNDHFYLFTRNRKSKFNGNTKLYRFPAKEGNFKAELIDQFKICDNKKGCQITSAAIHHKSGTIALLTYNSVWLLSNYSDDHFLNGDKIKIDLEHYSQKESITFKNEHTIYIADERSGMDGGNLYMLKLPPH